MLLLGETRQLVCMNKKILTKTQASESNASDHLDPKSVTSHLIHMMTYQKGICKHFIPNNNSLKISSDFRGQVC